MRVKFRIETMRLAGAWFLEQLEAHPHLRQRFRGDTLAFMTSLATRTGEEIKIDRTFAQRFVSGWQIILRRLDSELILQPRPYLGPAITGEEAIAELVGDIKIRLSAKRGRPPLDPLVALSAVKHHKGARSRGDAERSHERAMFDLNIKSKGAFAEAVKKGKAIDRRVGDVMKRLPPGTDLHTLLIDPHRADGPMILGLKVPPCKQEAD